MPRFKLKKISPASFKAPASINKIAFTLLTGPKESRCTKAFHIDDHGMLIKNSAPQFSAGKAETLTINSLDELPPFLDGLNKNQCISTGIFDQKSCSVITQKELTQDKENNGYRTRSKKHMKEPKCGLILLDYDSSPNMPNELKCNSVMEVIDKLSTAIPEFKSAGFVGSNSSSSGIHNPKADKSFSGGGFHIYLVVEKEDSSDLKNQLEMRLWNAGLGYIDFARNGSMLKRSIIDTAVFSPERLVYEARPELGSGLSQHDREWVIRQGTPLKLNLTTSDNQKKEYQQRVKSVLTAPANIEHSELIKRSYIENKASKYATEHSIPISAAVKHIARQVCSIEHGAETTLAADYLLEMDGQETTTGHLLQHGDQYDGRYLPDPIEGPEYGQSTAVFNFNGGYSPRITSFAHGVTTIFKLSEFTQISPELTQQSAATNRKSITDHPLGGFSLNGQGATLLDQMKKETFVLPSLALKGQGTIIFGQYNAGKTLCVLASLTTPHNSNHVDLSDVFYINADDSHKGMVEKLQIAEEIGFQMLCPGHNGFKTSDLIPAIQEMIANKTVGGTTLIVDTMKKFIDPMSKKDARNFGIIIREFIALGGTYIALAHTNKHPGPDKKPVFAGVSDPVDDADCAFILNTVKVDSESKIVQFENIKSRGNVAQQVTFEYSNRQEDSYSQRLASVKEIDLEQEEQYQEPQVNTDEEAIIEAITVQITNGINTKMKLAKNAAESSGASKRKVMGVLEKYTGKDPSLHKWNFIRGKKGANIFSLLKPESEA